MKPIKSFVIAIISFFLLHQTHAASVDYEVSMNQPHTHYFEVKMVIKNHTENKVDVYMPVWAPGSYLVREFSKHVEEVKATQKNKTLSIEKINKNTWQITSDGKDNIVVTYKVYAFEMSVRTSFLDASHGYFNGTSLFMAYQPAQKNPSNVTIFPYKDWKKVSTGLPKAKGAKGFEYTAENYDILVDAPFEIGNQVTFDFTASGVLHHVAIYGEGNYNVDTLKKDMAKIVEACTAVFGENPNKEYTFIIHNLTRGSGGLEHLNSTTLQVNRWTYSGDAYKRFLSLVAHEYFHLWNVKRIRPFELGPFDYSNENYTTLLWVMEGFTSYYDELLLYRAGFYSEEEITGKLSSSINNIENQPGNKVQPVAHASFDAWIKAYRPNENSYNTTISYYTKGSVVANILDIIIIKNTQGKKSLDDVMKTLYSKFYKEKNRGFTAKEMKQTLEEISGQNLDEFYTKYINGTETFDYVNTFSHIGYQIEPLVIQDMSLGVSLSGNNIRTVYRNSAAYDGGLNVNDEILAINNYRFDNNFDEITEDIKEGDILDVLISRDNIIQQIKITMKPRVITRYYFMPAENSSDETKKLHDVWLKKI